jgi:acyl carrier protein
MVARFRRDLPNREENLMTEQDALEWIAKLFEERPDQLTPDSNRDKIKAWDSLGVLLLMGGLDSDFGIQLSDDEVQGMKTVNDILTIMRRQGKIA